MLTGDGTRPGRTVSGAAQSLGNGVRSSQGNNVLQQVVLVFGARPGRKGRGQGGGQGRATELGAGGKIEAREAVQGLTGSFD